MNRRHFKSASQIRRQHNRQPGECTLCGKPVARGRRKWCSQQCVDLYMLRSSASYARRLVLARDLGICALCGEDCEALGETVRSLKRHAGIKFWYGVSMMFGLPWDCGSLWQADHIVPVAEGGLEMGLDNLRTLCLWCHRGETAKLARRLAERRKLQDPQQRLRFG